MHTKKNSKKVHCNTSSLFWPMDFFQIMLFQQVSCDLSKHYQQVSESAQDSLQPHPSSLLAKCHWQKNVTETDLKAGKKKPWCKQQFYTAENPHCVKCLPLHLQRLAPSIVGSCITYFLPKNEWLLCWYVLWKKKTQTNIKMIKRKLPH